MEEKKKKQRIGVYICHCGGNISDYVDVEQLRDIVGQEENVAVSKNVMFACADSNQKEMIKDIQEKQLDGIVVASCSPKLHLHTFRGVAERAGLNVVDRFSFGKDYVKTLREWSSRMRARSEEIAALGHDERFMRNWQYYLGICAAAFNAGQTDVVQVELVNA